MINKKNNNENSVFMKNLKFLKELTDNILKYTTSSKNFDIYLISFLYRNINTYL